MVEKEEAAVEERNTTNIIRGVRGAKGLKEARVLKP
jgi:hypothetical protein